MSQDVNPNDMPFDEEFLNTYYSKLVDRLEGINDRIWTQTKYYTSLFVSLLTIPIIIFFQYDLFQENTFWIIILILLPASGIVVVLIAYQSNLKLFQNVYEYVAIMSKIESEFKIGSKRVKKEILSNDEYLLPEEYLTVKSNNNITSTKEFLKEIIFGEQRKGKIGHFIRRLYECMILFAILEIVAFIAVFSYSFLNVKGNTEIIVIIILLTLILLLVVFLILYVFRKRMKEKFKES